MLPDGSVGAAAEDVRADSADRLHRDDRVPGPHPVRRLLVENHTAGTSVRRCTGTYLARLKSK